MSSESQSRLSFQIEDRKKGRKTDLWRVWDLHHSAYAGEVTWIKSIRKYGFHQTSSAALLDSDCLRELAVFCEFETRRHIVGRRSFTE